MLKFPASEFFVSKKLFIPSFVYTFMVATDIDFGRNTGGKAPKI